MRLVDEKKIVVILPSIDLSSSVQMTVAPALRVVVKVTNYQEAAVLDID